VADFSPRSPTASLSPPSSHCDSGHDGHRDLDYGGSYGGGPILQAFTCFQGVIDGKPPGGAPRLGGSGHGVRRSMAGAGSRRLHVTPACQKQKQME